MSGTRSRGPSSWHLREAGRTPGARARAGAEGRDADGRVLQRVQKLPSH